MKVALVTGGATGIGAATVKALAEEKISVALQYSSSQVEAKKLSDQLNAQGFKVEIFQADLSQKGSAENLVAQVKQKLGDIDILVNNAGTILRDPAAEHSDEYWDEVMEVNLSSQFILSREIGRTMITHGAGKIIFTASLLSFQGGINVPGYAASKGGVARLTMALANEWASKGINVNAIAPGYISTDNTTALREDKERSASILGRIPAGRWGEPADFKGPVVFLASEASNYVHGTILTVDGGWMGR